MDDPLAAAAADLERVAQSDVPLWMRSQAATMAVSDPAVIDSIISDTMTRLSDLLAQPASDQRTTPLQVLRDGIATLRQQCQGDGVSATAELASWNEISEAAGEAGIRWGAAKAFVHLQARQQLD